MKISAIQIEAVAESVLSTYCGSSIFPLCPTDVEGILRNLMKMDIVYLPLSSPDFEILGLTAYNDMQIVLNSDEPDRILHVKKDTVYIDASLLSDKMKGRRNFTLAHECAHRILHHMEKRTVQSVPENNKRTCFLRELHSEYDFREWQANTMASCLLMPASLLRYYLYLTRKHRKFLFFGDRIAPFDRTDYRKMADFFGVSVQALGYRLKHLGLSEACSADQYVSNTMDILGEDVWESIR